MHLNIVENVSLTQVLYIHYNNNIDQFIKIILWEKN